MQTITREELVRRLDRGDALTLVEALPEMYYADKHLPGAVRINHDEVAQRAPSLLPDKGATIVTYCASPTCTNSTVAARRLEALGYTDVLEYAEGKSDWEEAGLPLESSTAAAA